MLTDSCGALVSSLKVVRTTGIYSSWSRVCPFATTPKVVGATAFPLHGAGPFVVGSAPKAVRTTGRLALCGAKLFAVDSALKVVQTTEKVDFRCNGTESR